MWDIFQIHDLVILLLMAVLAWAAWGDIQSLIIPNRLVLAVLGLYPAYVLAAPYPVEILHGVIAALSLFTIGLVLFMFRLMGGGDVKLLAALGLWAGAGQLMPLIYGMLISGALLSVMMMGSWRMRLAYMFDRAGDETLSQALMRDQIPYGIAIAVGGFHVAFGLLALA